VAIFTTLGLQDKLNYLLGITGAFPLELNLYVNVYTVTYATLITDVTRIDLSLASPVSLVPSSWVLVSTIGLATATYSPILFTFPAYSGPLVTVYGYYIRNTADNVLIAGETAVTGYPIALTGGQLLLTPTWLDANL
jgi:hypothetical protein